MLSDAVAAAVLALGWVVAGLVLAVVARGDARRARLQHDLAHE